MQPGNNLPTTEIKAVFFRDILTLVLTKNNLHIQKSFWYHQKSGTAMDCLISVFFANAFLFYRMEKLLRNPPADLKYLGRYIDDLVGVWTGAPDDIPNLFYTTIQAVRERVCVTWKVKRGIHMKTLFISGFQNQNPATKRHYHSNCTTTLQYN